MCNFCAIKKVPLKYQFYAAQNINIALKIILIQVPCYLINYSNFKQYVLMEDDKIIPNWQIYACWVKMQQYKTEFAITTSHNGVKDFKITQQLDTVLKGYWSSCTEEIRLYISFNKFFKNRLCQFLKLPRLATSSIRHFTIKHCKGLIKHIQQGRFIIFVRFYKYITYKNFKVLASENSGMTNQHPKKITKFLRKHFSIQCPIQEKFTMCQTMRNLRDLKMRIFSYQINKLND